MPQSGQAWAAMQTHGMLSAPKQCGKQVGPELQPGPPYIPHVYLFIPCKGALWPGTVLCMVREGHSDIKKDIRKRSRGDLPVIPAVLVLSHLS